MLITVVGILCTVVLVGIFIILFLNRGSDAVIPILVKVAAAVAAAAILLTIELSKVPETLHSKSSFLILRNEDAKLLYLTPVTAAMNLPMFHAYSLLDKIWLLRGYTPQNEPFSMDNHVFDELLVATFLKWMAHHYYLHWEMEHYSVAAISGGGVNASQKEGRDNDTAVYRFADSANGFLVSDPVFNEIRLPKGSKASLHKSVFTIKNRNMTFTFKALRLGNSGVSHSLLGDRIDARLKEPGSFYAHDYIITLDATFSKFLRWSPHTRKQKEWMKQVFDNFATDFNWDSFKTQLNDALGEISEGTSLVGVPLRIIREKGTSVPNP